MKYDYVGYSKSGEHVSGTVEAEDRQTARDNLRRDGTIALSIDPRETGNPSANSGPTARPSGSRRRARTGTRLRRVCMFARQLQVLLSSGTPILQALSALKRQHSAPDWHAVITDVFRRVEEGSPLSEGLSTRPDYFDSVTLSLVAAGEASGDMPAMFERLSILTRKQLQLRSAVVGALVYPGILISLGATVVCVMLLFVLPRFEDLFGQIDGVLPLSTQLLLELSALLRGYWWAALAGTLLLCVGGIHLFSRPRVRDAIDSWLLTLPRLGRLLKSIASAKLARMLGTLLECKVPLLDALELARGTMTHSQYVRLIDRAHDAVTRGEAVSIVFGTSHLIEPCIQEAIIHGESSGQLGRPLMQMADFLEEENDAVVKMATRLIEPAVLALLGLIVGVIAMSMFLPLFDLVSSVNGGQ
jgi:type IV pilus assembly protein PilC